MYCQKKTHENKYGALRERSFHIHFSLSLYVCMFSYIFCILLDRTRRMHITRYVAIDAIRRQTQNQRENAEKYRSSLQIE